jgi:fructuronate reductase
VIEDDFADGRPDWDLAGAQFVKSVEAHELMKLRCLNGTHSSLAYLGYLAGHETISDVVSDPVFAHFCKNLWRQEILPTVPQPEGEDLTRYTASLFERYRNPAIRHRTWQIAMDGSQKLPQRILGTIADRLARDQVPTGLCLTVAAWMRYVGGKDEQGAVIDVRDPMAGRFRALSGAGGTAAAKVERFLEITDIFPAELARDQRFIGTVTQAYEILQVQGARAAVASENRMSS